MGENLCQLYICQGIDRELKKLSSTKKTKEPMKK
jgi:hypothetical protein